MCPKSQLQACEGMLASVNHASDLLGFRGLMEGIL